MENSCQILSNKRILPLQIICQEIKVNHRKCFLIFAPIIWDIFLNQNKIIWTLTVDTGKHENIFFWVDFQIAPLTKSIDTAQPGNTERVSNILPEFSSTKSPGLVYLSFYIKII